jgi:glycosyltransferase involved in cell wall biosynthesis
VENRLLHLLSYCDGVETKIIAPVPWFPISGKAFGKYGKYAAVERIEHRNGVDVFHPRYINLPKVGMTLSPFTLAATMYRIASRIRSLGWDFDLIDAHYFYPDGVAATLLGKWLKRPVVVTARGTDINLIPRYRIPRRLIKWAARECHGMITVCDALRSSLLELGAAAEKVVTLRNGVDLQMFSPKNKEDARRRLDLDESEKIVLSVGHLVKRKGNHFVVDALSKLDTSVKLLIVGDGEERDALRKQAAAQGLEHRVRFCGATTQSELPWYYSAADVSVLASSREGMANVLLESIACGTPVAATNIWGTPEVISNGVSGRLVENRDADGIANAIVQLLEDPISTELVRTYAEKFSWEATNEGQLSVFRKAMKSYIEGQAGT